MIRRSFADHHEAPRARRLKRSKVELAERREVAASLREEQPHAAMPQHGRTDAGLTSQASVRGFSARKASIGLDGWQALNDVRRGGHHITRIAATPMSQILDSKRRELWVKMGESRSQTGRGPGEDGSGRPEFPPARYLIDKVNFSLESETAALTKEQRELPPNEQQQACKARYAEEAEAQAAWEAASRPA